MKFAMKVKRICVVGLGLIGGSLLMALSKDGRMEVVGLDNNPDVIGFIKEKRNLNNVTLHPEEALSGTDMVILAIYPKSIKDFLNKNKEFFKEGVFITDVCGNKDSVKKTILENMPPSAFYVGAHPMAGREVDGIQNAKEDLFKNAGFIITPLDNSLKQQEGVRFLEEIARVIGSNPVVIPIDKHDSILAYTSHLMHAVSCALVLRPQKNLKIEYTAGAFRDMTRIADINPVLWTQLFLDNKENVLIEIDKFMENMLKLKRLIENDDEEGLKETLGIVRNNKLTIFEGGKEDGS